MQPTEHSDRSTSEGAKKEQTFNPWRQLSGILIPLALVLDRNLSHGAKLCYGWLMRLAGPSGRAMASERQLGLRLGVHERKARWYISQLKRAGYIRSVQGSGFTGVYEFVLHPSFLKTAATPPAAASAPGAAESVPGVPNGPKGNTADDIGRGGERPRPETAWGVGRKRPGGPADSGRGLRKVMNTSLNSTEVHTSSSGGRMGELSSFAHLKAERNRGEAPLGEGLVPADFIGEYAWRLDDKVRPAFLAMVQNFDADQETALHRELKRLGRRGATKLLDGLVGKMSQDDTGELPG